MVEGGNTRAVAGIRPLHRHQSRVLLSPGLTRGSAVLYAQLGNTRSCTAVPLPGFAEEEPVRAPSGPLSDG